MIAKKRNISSRACAAKVEGLAAAEAQGLNICGDMKGHPSLATYIEDGYEVISF